MLVVVRVVYRYRKIRRISYCMGFASVQEDNQC